MEILGKRIGWDISHLEFTIEDHYYFSRLKSSLKSNHLNVNEVRNFYDLRNFDILVLNYPEISFKKEESEFIFSQVYSGKRVIVTGYYNNEDDISNTVNSLSVNFGVKLNSDEIKSYSSNFDGDPLLPVTENILSYNESVSSVMIPCSASITVSGLHSTPFLLSDSGTGGENNIMGTVSRIGHGEFVLVGSCVFWDNNAITKYNNFEFALNLLTDGISGYRTRRWS